MRRVNFITLGCKTNQYETNAMKQKFEERGYIVTEDIADIYVVNTCSVTNIAERKSRQMLRRAKDKNKSAIVVASGCYSQVAKEEIENIEEVDIIVGNNEKNNIVDIVEEYISSLEKSVVVSDVLHKESYEEFGLTTYTELNRAVIKIQDGCDRFCSYCIIPFARGKVRSRKPDSIIEEIKKIAEEGIKEVVLTGIHIASYGKDFDKEYVEELRERYSLTDSYDEYTDKDDLHSGGFRLIDLIEQINKIDKIERIRLGSIEPKLITKEFAKRLASYEKVCNHFHLSLQSGCDETLARMNRRYNTEDFKCTVKWLREYFKDVILTTDIIVGFPGETDEEFNETYKYLQGIKFYKMHIFKYSPKKGTKAITMAKQVDGNKKEERSKTLIALSDKNEREYNEENLGRKVKVLFEEKQDGYYRGHTTNYLLVKVPEEEFEYNEEKIKENKKEKEIIDNIYEVKLIKIDENIQSEIIGSIKS